MLFLFWQRFKAWCLGSNDNPYRYTHHAVLLLGALAYLYCALFNYIFDFSHIFNIVLQLAFVPSILWIWYRSRWKDDFQRMAFVFMLMVTLMSLPANWLGNGGMSGPTFLLNICCLMYISVAFHDLGWYRRIGQLLAILVPIPLLWFETSYPEYVFYHETKFNRDLDMLFSFLVTGLFIILMMNSYSKRFKLEHDKVKALSDQLRILSECDPLTGLHNRRVFEHKFERWQSEQAEFSLAILDIDHFKQINDKWGHTYGDKVLRMFADLLSSCATTQGCVAIRLGGEEFVLLIPRNRQGAQHLLENFRLDLQQIPFDNGSVQFSAGLSEYGPSDSRDSVLKRADDYLYMAKNAGRNRIFCEEDAKLASGAAG